MRFASIAAAVLLAVPLTSASAAMDVATFLAKADALRAKGPMALFSSDVGLLKNEVQSAALALRTERLALLKTGKKAAYCPPAKGSMDSEELMAAMHGVPVADRSRTDVKAVVRSILVRKYPCRA